MSVINKILNSCKALFTFIAIIIGAIITFTHNTDFANIATICFGCIPAYLALNVAEDFAIKAKEGKKEFDE